MPLMLLLEIKVIKVFLLVVFKIMTCLKEQGGKYQNAVKVNCVKLGNTETVVAVCGCLSMTTAVCCTEKMSMSSS